MGPSKIRISILLLSIAAVALSLQTAVLQEKAISTMQGVLALLSGFFVLVSYSLYYLVGATEAIGELPKALIQLRMIEKTGLVIGLAGVIITIVVGFAYGFTNEAWILFSILVCSMLTRLYWFRTGKFWPPFRTIPILKWLSLCVCWSLVTLLTIQPNAGNAWTILAHRFCFISMVAIPFDLRDISNARNSKRLRSLYQWGWAASAVAAFALFIPLIFANYLQPIVSTILTIWQVIPAAISGYFIFTKYDKPSTYLFLDLQLLLHPVGIILLYYFRF